MSNVSEAAVLRELDANELEQEFHKIKAEYLEKYSHTIDFLATSEISKKVRIIKTQYFQLTQKQLT